MFKTITLSILGVVALFALIWGLSYHEIIFTRFFAPKRENVRREVFEETKSYVHGKTQDLAKYFEEYQKAESQDDKEAVANIIKMQFASFDASKIDNFKLRQFLLSVRGF